MPKLTLIALHGYTLNGAQMKRALEPLEAELTAHVELIYPDAPHVCAPDSVDRMYQLWRTPRLAPPYLSFWDASEDGRIYRGWEQSRDAISALMAAHQPAAVLGFSQGAMLAAALAALSDRGEIPKLEFVILVAGSMPRADALLALLDRPIQIPSLHVWGERDALARARAPSLIERFAETTRKTVIWPGPHVVPTRGPGAQAIVEFVRTRS